MGTYAHHVVTIVIQILMLLIGKEMRRVASSSVLILLPALAKIEDPDDVTPQFSPYGGRMNPFKLADSLV